MNRALVFEVWSERPLSRCGTNLTEHEGDGRPTPRDGSCGEPQALLLHPILC